MGGLAVLLGFDAADGLGGGPPDDAGVVAGQVDGDRVGGDVDGDDAPGVDAARAIFCAAIMITPVLLATRWAATGSVEGRGGGPAGRAPRILRACSQVSGLGRVRSSSRVAGSKNIRVACSTRTETRRPPRISAARMYRPARCTAPSLLTVRSTSIAAPGSAGGSGGGPAGRAPAAARAVRRPRTGGSGQS